MLEVYDGPKEFDKQVAKQYLHHKNSIIFIYTCNLSYHDKVSTKRKRL